MHRASDHVTEQATLERLQEIARTLELSDPTISLAGELYLSNLPVVERSKQALLATSCYTAALISGEERSQGEIARAFGVSRLSIQSKWKQQLETFGLTPPTW